MADVSSPLVPGANTILLKTLPAIKLINDWRAAFDIDISNELNGIPEISLFRCETSHLEFFTPLSAIGSDNLYSQLAKFDWFYMVEKWEFDTALADLAGCKRILEVGCGPGLFIEKAAIKLQGSKVTGIELNENAVDQALRKNLCVERSELRKLQNRKERFDAICAFQVLEHVNHPLDFLNQMVRLLVPGGRLILSVPNKESFLRHQYNLLDMPPHHMTRWNTFSFKYLEKLLPIKIKKIRFEPLADYHIQGYIMAYGQYWRSGSHFMKSILTDSRLDMISKILKKTGFNRLLRGQSLYVLLQKS